MRNTVELISPGKDDAALRRLTGHHALARFLRPVERDAANGRLSLGGDTILRRPCPVPVSPQEAARLLDLLLELVVGVHLETVRVAEFPRPLEQVLLNLAE